MNANYAKYTRVFNATVVSYQIKNLRDVKVRAASFIPSQLEGEKKVALMLKKITQFVSM